MENRILRLPEVKNRSGYSRAILYRRIADQLWTKPVRLGARTVGWPANEVDKLIGVRIASYSEQDIKNLVAQLEAERKKLIDVN